MDSPWIRPVVSLAVALIVAAVVLVIATLVMRAIARRHSWARSLAVRMRSPFRVLLVVIAVRVAFSLGVPAFEFRDVLDHLLLIVTIAVGAWFAAAAVTFFEDLGLARYRVDVPDNRVARRMHTQLQIIRRITIVVIVVIAAAAILFTFPGTQAVGASVLASAGLVSIIAGLAAQSTLANVFAGMQLAFSDAIRVDDVVIAEGQWGRIEEITLTYVVVHIWDDRRLVLPSTYFTTTPFENWTRRNSELLGSIEFDLDWRVTPAEMRTELARILESTELWDGRASVLQVTDAVGGFVRVRILVTAEDAAKLFDLRCYVREEMISWLHTSSPSALPRSRVQLVEAEPAKRARRGAPGSDASALFSGDDAAVERGSQFTGPIETIRRTGTGSISLPDEGQPTVPLPRSSPGREEPTP